MVIDGVRARATVDMQIVGLGQGLAIGVHACNTRSAGEDTRRTHSYHSLCRGHDTEVDVLLECVVRGRYDAETDLLPTRRGQDESDGGGTG